MYILGLLIQSASIKHESAIDKAWREHEIAIAICVCRFHPFSSWLIPSLTVCLEPKLKLFLHELVIEFGSLSAFLAQLFLSSISTSSPESATHTCTLLLCFSLPFQCTWPHSSEISLFHLATEKAYLSIGPWTAWFTGWYSWVIPDTQRKPQSHLALHNTRSFKDLHRNIIWKSCASPIESSIFPSNIHSWKSVMFLSVKELDQDTNR